MTKVVLKRIAAAVASGLVVACAFPPLDLTWLVWVGMMPLLWALWSIEGKRSGLRGFGIGYLAGLAACLIQFNWVASVSWLGALVLPAYLAVYWGLFGFFAVRIGNPWKSGKPAGILKVAFCHGAVWAGCELLRGWVITGISWNVLGTAFHDTPLMAQAADLFGVVGLSMALVFFQAAAVQAIATRKWPALGIATAVMAAIAIYGAVRIRMENGRESIRLKTLLVQLNIPMEASRFLWTDEEVHMGYEEETLEGLEKLKSPEGILSQQWPDWVMWPECALNGRLIFTVKGQVDMWDINKQTISQVRTGGPFSLIYGVYEVEGENDTFAPTPKGRAYNSLAFMTPDDEIATYRKRHLVIFGETIPFAEYVPWLIRIFEQQAGAEYNGGFSVGESTEPVPVMVGDREIGAIPTVCFEDSVPRLTRKFVRPGPQVIVNVTNDGWFKESAAADQHFQYARFRAIELRRPMLRSANTGVSAAIDTTGSTAHPDTGKTQIVMDEKGSHFTQGSLLTELKVPLNPGFSLYAIIGDYGLIGIALLGLGLAGLSRKAAEAVEG